MFECRPENRFELKFSDIKTVNDEAELEFPLKKLT